MNLGVAILAAGASTRMGRPKMLLPWENTSVLGHIIAVWTHRLRATQVAVVCAPLPSPVPAELDRIAFPAQNRITNPTPENGMFSSIQAAAAWCNWSTDLTHIALVLGDQPHLRVSTLAELCRAAEKNPGAILQPSFNGKPRHPVFLPREAFRTLAGTPHSTLRDFLAVQSRTLLPITDPGLDLDLDYPADYEAARELTSQTQSE